MSERRLRLVAEATLIFHSGDFPPEKKLRWSNIAAEILGVPRDVDVGAYASAGWECTTRVLCDMARKVLNE